MTRKLLGASALAAIAGLCLSAPSQAQTIVPPLVPKQPIDKEKQDDLNTAHSVLQKTGLGTLGVTGVLGAALFANHKTAFGNGRCASGDPWFGDFGCGDLKYVHFAFAATTLGLFAATEIVAENMPVSPYESADRGKETAMRTLRVANIGLFAVQPVLGLIAANPGLVGVHSNASNFSSVMRTIHFGVGGTVATTYTVNAAMQW